ncbi:MAG: PP2C family serine/threonine-protein phosphatase [Arenimonas sp.]
MQCQVYAASAIGKSHIDGEIPCQDAFAYRVIEDVLIAIVCDGAGSAAVSHLGSDFAANALVSALAEGYAANECTHLLDVENFKQQIEKEIGSFREKLEAQAKTENRTLADYAATLVGVVTNASQGYFFHIGDGLAIAQHSQNPEAAVMSLPENGEYANETYFITGAEWAAHLRVTAIVNPIDLLALMSDGAAPFVMNKGNSDFHRPFIDPVANYLRSVSEEDGSIALASTLADVRTYQITSDDKALLIAMWS